MTMIEAEIGETVDTTADTQMIVAGDTPADILRNAANIAGPLADLINRQELFVTVGKNRKTGEERRHVEVSGWQAAGAMLGALGGQPLHAETIWSRRVQRDDDVIAYESRCEIRTLHGEVVGAAESLCSSEESNWRGRDEFAIKGMAETRAESRAYRRAIGWIISLAGFSPTPAEEMGATPAGGEGARTGALPAWAQPMNDIAGVARNLTRVLAAMGVAESAAATTAIGEEVFELCDQTFPFALARMLHRLNEYVPVDTAPVVAEGQNEYEATQGTNDTNETQENDA